MIAQNRENGGKLVRLAWIEWAQRQSDPKPSWLVPWEGLGESDKEADRCIWDAITAPYTTAIAHLHTKIAVLEHDVARLEQANTELNDARKYSEY